MAARTEIQRRSTLEPLTQRLLWPLTGLAQVIDLFERAMASTRRILDLLEVPITVKDDSTTPLIQPVRGEVTIDNVSFHYATSGVGVENIHLHAPAGNTLALVGACATAGWTVELGKRSDRARRAPVRRNVSPVFSRPP